MADMEQDLVRTHAAYHEAGHVIAGLLFGYRFTVVTIKPGESGADDHAVHGISRGRARDLAVVQLAGIVASAKMTGCKPFENPDRFDDDSADMATAGTFIDNWVAFLAKTYGEAAYRNQIWDETVNKTRLLVEDNWKPIGVVAGALLEKETLAYDAVLRILKVQCPDFILGKSHWG